MIIPLRRRPRRIGPALGCAVLGVCGLFASAGQAQARAKVVSLGPTDNVAAPRVIVNPSGEGYTTWTATGSGEATNYCRLTIGPSACRSRESFHYPAATQPQDNGSAPVFTASGAVAILDSRSGLDSNQKFLYTSATGGSSFGAPVPLVADGASGSTGDVLDLPPGALTAGSPEQLLTVDDGDVTGGGSVQATGLSASATDPGWFQPPVNASGTISESVAREGSTLVIAYTQDSSPNAVVRWVKDSGGGNPDLAGSWSASQNVAPTAADDSSAALAGGPAGIFMARSVLRPGDNEALVLQRFTGAGWSAAKTISTTLQQGALAITESPSGRVYVAWRDSSGRLHYTVSANRTATRFSPADTLATGSARVGDPAIAVNAFGAGWVTWTDGAGRGHAVAIAPGPKRTVLKLSDGGRLTLLTPGGCAVPGARFPASLGLRAAAPHRATYLTVERVGFGYGSATRTVGRAAFRVQLAVPGSARRGSTTRIRARVTLSRAHGHPSLKALRATLPICPA